MTWLERTTIVTALALGGCITDEAEGAADAGAPGAQVITHTHTLPEAQLDVLLVVDNSGSMCEEQGQLAGAVPDMLAQWPGVDVRVAVISTDMNDPEHSGRFVTKVAPPVEAPNCAIGPPDTAACPADLAPVLRGDLPDAAERLACMVQLGTNGYGFERGLAAMRAATACDGPNAAHFAACCDGDRFDPACAAEVAFLRPDAALLVVVLSDEDDCSDAGAVDVSANSNCEWDRDRLTPVADFAAHLANLKANPAAQIGVLAVVGERAYDAAGHVRHWRRAEGAADEACLDDRGQYDASLDVDGTCCAEGECPGGLQPTCEGELGAAFAGHRYLDIAAQFPLGGEPPSICGDRWTDRLGALTERLGHGAWCLEHPPVAGTVSAQIDGVDVGFELVEVADCGGGVGVRLDVEPEPGSTLTLRYEAATGS